MKTSVLPCYAVVLLCAWDTVRRLKGLTRRPLKTGGDDHGTEAAGIKPRRRHRSIQGRPRMPEG